MAESLARGEPHRGRIAVTLFRDKMKDWSDPVGRGRNHRPEEAV